MPQLFTPAADVILRRLAIGLVVVLALVATTGFLYVRSDPFWGKHRPLAQPVPFRHDLHAGGLGMDCRYCHHTVEHDARAGMPTAVTCLGCHDQVQAGAAFLEPLRTSLALGMPLEWRSVHALPGDIRFHHGAHVAGGVDCAACHGEVQRMSATVRTETLSMGWCLDCHRHAESVRPATAAGPHAAGATADPARLVNCHTCHK